MGKKAEAKASVGKARQPTLQVALSVDQLNAASKVELNKWTVGMRNILRYKKSEACLKAWVLSLLMKLNALRPPTSTCA